MAGLLYLPRLFVYHAEQLEKGGMDTSVFITMERKLLKFIMNKAMMATWIFGLLLVGTPGIVDLGQDFWFYGKFLFVVLMTAFHVWLSRCQKDFEAGQNQRSSRTYRMVNEIPAVFMVIIVALVVVKPF